MSYIEKIKFITKKQYAFQKNANTQLAVHDLIDEVENEIEKNKYTTIIFLDLKKRLTQYPKKY